jgi:hypothetical protein
LIHVIDLRAGLRSLRLGTFVAHAFFRSKVRNIGTWVKRENEDFKSAYTVIHMNKTITENTMAVWWSGIVSACGIIIREIESHRGLPTVVVKNNTRERKNG